MERYRKNLNAVVLCSKSFLNTHLVILGTGIKIFFLKSPCRSGLVDYPTYLFMFEKKPSKAM
jgi:hypothetical protein